ncbi:MAG: hypothetical protein L3J82_06120, partial [Planctomycetes bacterium]|nr:hypothetical protein [Planctomycetota bacterium]
MAACKDSSPPINQARAEKADSASPDYSLVIIKNLESYTIDCGCSGNIRGGVGRVAASASGEKRRFVFVGRVTLTKKQIESQDYLATTQHRYQMRLFLAFIEKMDNVVVAPLPDESEILSQGKGVEFERLRKYLASSASIGTPFGTGSVTDTEGV